MCSPAEFISMTEDDGRGLRVSFAGRLLNVFGEKETATYPSPCKARMVDAETGNSYYPFQSPHSLSMLSLLSELEQAGVDALKVEGRQRSHVYVRRVARVFRKALDELAARGEIDEGRVAAWERELASLFEGRDLTTGCYGEK